MQQLRKQTEAKIAQGRKANPNFMQGVDEIITEAKAFKHGENAIEVGEKAPYFELPNSLGSSVSLSNLLNKGPLVITFYRGSWCPYCNLQLRALQSRLTEINALGATLIAISPEVPDGSMTKSEITSLGFEVLSDQDAKVASQFGIAWEIPAFLLEHMRVDRNLDLKKINNGNGNIVSIPSTFSLGGDGVVKWSYVNVDYRIRTEPGDVIDALKNIP